MKCPDDGLLLAGLERQLGDAQMSEVDHHLASCRICKRRLQVLQEDLSFCRLEMVPLLQRGAEAPVNGQYRVWASISQTCYRDKGVKAIMKFRKLAVAAVVILTMVGLLSIPSVKAVADNLLQVFRVNQVSTVTLTPADVNHLRSALTMGNAEINLEQFGQIKTIGEPGVKKQVALDQLPPTVKLPAGQSPLALYAEDMPDAELKLNVSKVNQLLQQLGSADELPTSLEGQTFRLVLPEMVTAKYSDFKLLQGPSPEMQAPSGIDIVQIRKAVINLPIWTPSVRMQLTAIQDWQHTLIIPTDDSNRAEEVKVAGNRGIFIAGNDSSGQLMWQDDGRLMILEVNSGGVDQALTIAETLR